MPGMLDKICLFYVALGYLSGSVLYASIFLRLEQHRDIRTIQADHNPGVASAFLAGGPACGIPALIGDLGKGFLPVFLALRCIPITDIHIAFVLLAPVVGHAWPIFYRFRGGKAIAVSFGVLLGLCPRHPAPVFILVFFYLLFSLVLRIRPHGGRSIVTFFCAWLVMARYLVEPTVSVGFGLIACVVIARHLLDYFRRRNTYDAADCPCTENK